MANNINRMSYPPLPGSNDEDEKHFRFQERVNIRPYDVENAPSVIAATPSGRNSLALGPRQYRVHPNVLAGLKGRSGRIPKNPVTSARIGSAGLGYVLPAGSTRRNNAWSAELTNTIGKARASKENKPLATKTMKNARTAAILHHSQWQAENNAEQRTLKFSKVKEEALSALAASRRMRAEMNAKAANAGAGKSRRQRSRRARKGGKTRKYRK